MKIPHLLGDVIATLESGGAGTCYIVGGAVRDHLLGLKPKDIDIEVHGLPVENVERVLKIMGYVDKVGQSFGVYKVRFGNETYDFSLPRTERKTFEGHTGFDVEVDPFLGLEKALSRRDFTINAIAMRSDGSLVDPFGGIQDLIKGQLRHVGPAFSEDPLRILRGVQFAARFGFTLAPETAQLCRELASELDFISIERVWGEFEKIGLKGKSMDKAELALIECGFTDQRFGPVRLEHRREPDLEGLAGDRRVAVALASLYVDPAKINAPKSVTRMMEELYVAMANVRHGRFVYARSLARRLKHVTIFDAIRIMGPTAVDDPRVIHGPLPLFLNGFDVTERGVEGPEVGEILRRAAELQDAGVWTDRVEALEWLDFKVSATL